jgi:hypothetical protein
MKNNDSKIGIISSPFNFNTAAKISFLCPFYLLLFIMLVLHGCASFQYTGTRTVEGKPQRIGPMADTLAQYYKPMIVATPGNSNSKLVLKLMKDIYVTIQYDITLHKEAVLKRKPTLIQYFAEDVGDSFDSDPISGLIMATLMPFGIIIGILTGKTPAEETKYEYVPDSDSIRSEFRQIKKTVPASGESLLAVGIGQSQTDVNGYVIFNSLPERFDEGLEIRHLGTDWKYIVTREKYYREVHAKWYPAAKTLLFLNSVGAWVKVIKNLAAGTAGPGAVIGALIFDTVSGLVIGHIIDVVGTEEKEYYQWSIIRI